MRLREVEVEHFGVFSEQTLEFDAGFSLVFGPNEAGKSTLLQLIRELLFGFKAQQNPFVFADHAGEMAATAAFDMQDGSKLRYRRRKGTKNEVVGSLEPADREIDAKALSQLTGGANKELYEQVFGFSLRELAEADESLKRANLTEALYGGGLGGLANFQKTQAALQAEADALFTPRGSKQHIHKLLTAIKQQVKDQKAATVKPAEFEKLVRATNEANEEVNVHRSRREELRGRKAHLERLASAIEPWLQRQQAETDLASLNVPESLPSDCGERMERLVAQKTSITKEIAAIEQELAEETEEIAGLKQAPELIAREAEIRELEQRIAEIAGYQRDVPPLRQKSESTKAQVLRQLKDYSPDWNEEQLERFQTTLAQREQVEQLKAELDDLTQQKASTTAERKTVEADIASLTKQLDQLQADEAPPALTTLLEGAGDYQRNTDRLAELKEQHEDASEKLAALLTKLNSPINGEIDERSDLQVPLATTIEEFRTQLATVEQAVHEAQRKLESTREEQQEKQEQLAQLDATIAVPDREQLVATREHRDAGWKIIRQQLVSRRSIDPEAIVEWTQVTGTQLDDSLTTALAETYEASLANCDTLADERQSRAEQAATRDQLVFDIKRFAERNATQQQQLDEHIAARDKGLADWKKLWSECSFEPLTPDAMLDWLELYEEFVETRSSTQRLCSQVNAMQQSVDEFERRLAKVFPEAGLTPKQRLAQAKHQCEAAREAIVRRQTYAEQLPQKQETLNLLDKQLAEIEARSSAWQTKWERLLDELSFPRDWNVHLASKILGGLTEARSEWDKAVDLDKRVADMATGINAFQASVEALCDELAPDLRGFVPGHAMQELQLRLESAKAAERDQRRLSSSTEKLRKRLATQQNQLDEIDAEVAALCQAAGALNDSEFEQVAEAAKQRSELIAIRREASTRLNALRGTLDEENFEQELSQVDSDTIALDIDRVAEELKEVERSYDDAFGRSTLLEQERKQLDGTSRAAEIAVELESSRSQLASAVDRWAPLMLAQALMKQAIKKFERDHQPAMLADVERLLQRMTLGRYTTIERKLDEHGTLLVVDETGKRKEPHQLSTGTREQLYLAIRLAYIKHYCAESEPLPIVMDDVLVNFDAERAKQTLKAFADVADQVQIIFLTCHQHMIELVSDVFPKTKPIVLPGGKLADALVTSARRTNKKNRVVS